MFLRHFSSRLTCSLLLPPPFTHPNFADFRKEVRKAVTIKGNSNRAREQHEPFCFSVRCRKEQDWQEAFSSQLPGGCILLQVSTRSPFPTLQRKPPRTPPVGTPRTCSVTGRRREGCRCHARCSHLSSPSRRAILG